MDIEVTLLSKKDMSNIELTLSVSKAKTFEDCKAKYRFCYIDKLPRIEQDFHIFGKFLHQILENFHKALICEPDRAKYWQVVMEEAWNTAHTEYESQITGLQYKDAKNIIKEYCEILEEEGLPNVLANEKPFFIKLNSVLLNGYIDRVQVDSDGVLHVIDYKTTKDPKYLKDYFQLLTYAYALMLEDPKLNRVRASFVLLKHKFRYLTEEYTREQVMPIAEKFIKYYLNIQEEKTWRPNPQFLCKYCDYMEHCKAGKDYLVKKGIIEGKKNIPFVGMKKWGK
jgi:RecB family exonuclease